MKIACIIPSRYASTRLPGKPLRLIAGETLVHRVYERAVQAKLPDVVIVATDHEDIEKEVKSFGGHVMMTSVDHPTGTDRLAEVASHTPDYEIIVNVQGDEPLIDPDVIDRLAQDLIDHPELDMATVATPLHEDEYDDPSSVKVVVNQKGEALYFSRSLIPYPRHDFEVPAEATTSSTTTAQPMLTASSSRSALSPTSARTSPMRSMPTAKKSAF